MPVIDHVVVGAADLDAGAAAIEAQTGLTLGPGGKHGFMSTHNRLCQSGNGTYFELIAVDPDAPQPSRPRWFGMDAPRVREKLAERPRSIAFVVAVDGDLDALVARSPVPLGTIEAMSRGDLSWRVTLPEDGMPAEQGLVPSFIDWGGGPNPSANMADIGMTLRKVVASHPDPAALAAIYEALGMTGLVEIVSGPHGLSFVVDTPSGEVIFD